MVKVMLPEDNVGVEATDVPGDPEHQSPSLGHPPNSRLSSEGEPDSSEGAVGYSSNPDHCPDYVPNGITEHSHYTPHRSRSLPQYAGACNDSYQYISRQVESQFDTSGNHNSFPQRRHSTSETYGNVTQFSPVHRQSSVRCDSQYCVHDYNVTTNNSRGQPEDNCNIDYRHGCGSTLNSVERNCNGYGTGIQHDHLECTRINRARFRSGAGNNSSPSVGQAIDIHIVNRNQDSCCTESFGRNAEVRRGSFQAISNPRVDLAYCRRHSLQVDQVRETRGSVPDQPNTLSADHNHFAVNYFPSEVSPETALVGSDLFLMFLREEIEQRHLQPPDCLNPQQDIAPSSRALLGTSEFIQMGTQLRYVANEFAQSVHRQKLREQAESISLESLDFNSFSELMFVVFQEGGVTYERIIVLFFFCTDLAIRALREKLRARFHELTQWSQYYIMSKLSVWVEQQGGWSVILEHSVNKMYKAAIIGVCCMGMIAFWVYIRNNFR